MTDDKPVRGITPTSAFLGAGMVAICWATMSQGVHYNQPPSNPAAVSQKRTMEVLRDFPHKLYEDCRSLFIYVPGGDVETEDGLEKTLLKILPQRGNSISQLIQDYRKDGFSVACGDSNDAGMPETIRQHEENRQSYIVLGRNQ